jgi:hypothetical protein
VHDPFTLGVASGDPAPDGVLLWTRLTPDPLAGGGMPDEPVTVDWQVAADEQFRQVVAHGSVSARPELGHSVHVEVTGLEPGSAGVPSRPSRWKQRVGPARADIDLAALPDEQLAVELPGGRLVVGQQLGPTDGAVALMENLPVFGA